MTLGDDEPESMMIVLYPEVNSLYKAEEPEESMAKTEGRGNLSQTTIVVQYYQQGHIHFTIKITRQAEAIETRLWTRKRGASLPSLTLTLRRESEIDVTVHVDDVHTVVIGRIFSA